MNKTLIIIPSLNPDEKILTVVKNLKEKGFQNILVINDGSNKEKESYFIKLEKEFNCEIISYEKNKGKGRALKIGFFEVLKKKNIENVITVDGDNQHKAIDVCRVNREIKKGHIVLGSRTFSKEVPFRSRLGNNVISNLFKCISRSNITDTQTGLRGFSIEDLDKVMNIEGERFEYEMNVLLNLDKLSLKVVEVPIETVYIENNKTSHFRVVSDSVKILNRIFKFMISSYICFIVDIALFSLLHYIVLTGSVFIAALLSRVASSYLNYCINYKVVFKGSKNNSKTLFKYYLLVVVVMFLTSTLTMLLQGVGNIVLVKIIVDFVLFIFNYNVQKKYIFKEEEC